MNKEKEMMICDHAEECEKTDCPQRLGHKKDPGCMPDVCLIIKKQVVCVPYTESVEVKRNVVKDTPKMEVKSILNNAKNTKKIIAEMAVKLHDEKMEISDKYMKLQLQFENQKVGFDLNNQVISEQKEDIDSSFRKIRNKEKEISELKELNQSKDNRIANLKCLIEKKKNQEIVIENLRSELKEKDIIVSSLCRDIDELKN